MIFELRPAEPGDLYRCTEIEIDSFGDDFYNFTTLRQFLDIAGELFIVAVGEPTRERPEPDVLGYAVASPSTQDRLIWGLPLAVDEPYRHLGIGRELMMRTVSTCNLLGASRIRCTVRPDNAPSLSILRSLNFIEVAEDLHYFGRGKARKVLELLI
jgi:ribosomal protein S18 acetylase RimI-like enzyme